jgi:hypothetical protein
MKKEDGRKNRPYRDSRRDFGAFEYPLSSVDIAAVDK